jgi:hypothetical protein
MKHQNIVADIYLKSKIISKYISKKYYFDSDALTDRKCKVSYLFGIKWKCKFKPIAQVKYKVWASTKISDLFRFLLPLIWNIKESKT